MTLLPSNLISRTRLSVRHFARHLVTKELYGYQATLKRKTILLKLEVQVNTQREVLESFSLIPSLEKNFFVSYNSRREKHVGISLDITMRNKMSGKTSQNAWTRRTGKPVGFKRF